MIVLHTGSPFCEEWDAAFRDYFRKAGLKYKEYSFHRAPPEGDILVGRLNEYSEVSKEQYRQKAAGYRTCWPEIQSYDLYNDKLAEWLFFKGHGLPHPRTWYVESPRDLPDRPYPLVEKTREGSAGKGVRLVYDPSSVSYPRLLQEFCPDNDGDFRVTVVGDQVCGHWRENRPGDFRASGSGIAKAAPVPPECAKLALEAAKLVGAVTMAFDFVKDRRQKWTILEMSYTYPHSILLWGHNGFDPVPTIMAKLLAPTALASHQNVRS